MDFVQVRPVIYLLIMTVSMVVVWMWIENSFGMSNSTRELALSVLTVGFCRMSAAFSIGILVFKFRRSCRVPAWVSPSLAVGIFCFFAVPFGYMPRMAIFFVYVGVFPALLLLGSNVELQGRAKSVAALLGSLSYPVYVLHVPLIWMMGWSVKKMEFTNAAGHIWFGIIIIPIVLILSYIILKYYDEPMRGKLRKVLFAPSNF